MNILLVEDDVGIGRFVTRGLTARGHRLSWQRQGADVPDLIASGVFGAVLLDIGLPDMDGLALCRRIRAMAPRIQILMLTARDTLSDKLDGFGAGADDYLPKPFAFEELVARVAVLERRDTMQPPAPMRLGALEVDTDRRTAHWHGEALAVDGKAFDLLCCLVRAQGETVERPALIAEIWGESADITDNAVDANISALRRKLATLASPPVIETVRGRGFRLAV